MGSEIFLYGYGIVCFSMIVFNIIYNIIMDAKDHKLREDIEKYDMIIKGVLDDIREGRKAPKKHYRRIEKLLSTTMGLMTFEAAVDRHLEFENEAAVEYLISMGPILIKTAKKYLKRENLQAAYFAYFIGDEKFNGHIPKDELQEILIEYAAKDSFYCRVNAMRALYAFGDAWAIADAVTICDRNDAFFHAKVLQDGLLTYRGDSDELISILWKRFNSYKESTQIAIMNYIRFESDKYTDNMLDIMTNEEKEKELRLSAIRYLGKYPDERAREQLVAFVKDTEPANWEYAAVGASALAKYDGSDIVDVLIEAAHSLNWHVRNNAATSLKAKGIGYSQVEERVKDDKYADEILRYRLKEEYIAEEAV